jgi:hypothetical protein
MRGKLGLVPTVAAHFGREFSRFRIAVQASSGLSQIELDQYVSEYAPTKSGKEPTMARILLFYNIYNSSRFQPSLRRQINKGVFETC